MLTRFAINIKDIKKAALPTPAPTPGFWKSAVNGSFEIDYYDPAREFGSDDPSGPAKTARVLTIMLAEEY